MKALLPIMDCPKLIAMIVATALLAMPLHAADTACDSTSVATDGFDARQLIVPAAVITAGALTSISHPNSLVTEVDGWFNPGVHTYADDWLRYVPSAAYLGLMVLPGVKARHSVKERLLLAATAHVLSLGASYGLKYAVSEWRPDGSDHHSFPSGHVTLAFTGAELLRMEYGTVAGIAGYAVAATVAVLRVANHRHYLNDVLMGAGIGILGARAAAWLLPAERRLLRMDRQAVQAVIAPVYDPQHKALTMTLIATF